jgi:amidase
MPVDPPDATALAAVAQHYGLGLDAADLEQFSPMVAGLLASWNAVEDLYNTSVPGTPERTWNRPDDAD